MNAYEIMGWVIAGAFLLFIIWLAREEYHRQREREYPPGGSQSYDRRGGK